MVKLARLQAILERLPELRIALVGDLFLDRYLELVAGADERSLETGLEAYQVQRVRNAPGALGTVLNNLAALGVGRLIPVSVIGDDGHGWDLVERLGQLPVELAHVVRSGRRLTPTYIKPMRPRADGGWQELNRLDVRSREPLDGELTRRVVEAARDAFGRADAMVVLDQVHDADCGVVNRAVRQALAELADGRPATPILADSRGQLDRFDRLVLKGNAAEILRAASGRFVERPAGADAAIEAAGALAARRDGLVFCTLGEGGIAVADRQAEPVRVPAPRVRGPLDIVGAGDSATSGLIVSLACGASPVECAAVANLAASITIQQLGTTGTATSEQLLARWHEAQVQ